jgi:hypothetical protein
MDGQHHAACVSSRTRVDWLRNTGRIAVVARGADRLEGRAVHPSGIAFHYSLIKVQTPAGEMWGVYFDRTRNAINPNAGRSSGFVQERGATVDALRHQVRRHVRAAACHDELGGPPALPRGASAQRHHRRLRSLRALALPRRPQPLRPPWRGPPRARHRSRPGPSAPHRDRAGAQLHRAGRSRRAAWHQARQHDQPALHGLADPELDHRGHGDRRRRHGGRLPPPQRALAQRRGGAAPSWRMWTCR